MTWSRDPQWEPQRRAFELHKNHDWSCVDGAAWCDSCTMDIVHPTPVEREERSIESWGIDWRQRCRFEQGPIRQSETERLQWRLEVLQLQLHRTRLELCRLAVLDVNM